MHELKQIPSIKEQRGNICDSQKQKQKVKEVKNKKMIHIQGLKTYIEVKTNLVNRKLKVILTL